MTLLGLIQQTTTDQTVMHVSLTLRDWIVLLVVLVGHTSIVLGAWYKVMSRIAKVEEAVAANQSEIQRHLMDTKEIRRSEKDELSRQFDRLNNTVGLLSDRVAHLFGVWDARKIEIQRDEESK